MDPDRGAAPVLYVEDEENDVLLVQYRFSKARLGHPLKVLANGRDAVDYLSKLEAVPDRKQHPLPCLLILDLNLPVLSGLEVLQWVRRKPAFQHLPVVIFSSSEQTSDKERARELGANDYSLKPGDPDELVKWASELKQRWLEKTGP